MQDTLSECSAHNRADAEDRLAAGEAAEGSGLIDPTAVDQSAIEKCIAQTLSELDADDPEPFVVGSVPLDDLDAPPQQRSARHQHARPDRRRQTSGEDSTNHRILMAMLVSALLALGLVSFGVSEGFIP